MSARATNTSTSSRVARTAYGACYDPRTGISLQTITPTAECMYGSPFSQPFSPPYGYYVPTGPTTASMYEQQAYAGYGAQNERHPLASTAYGLADLPQPYYVFPKNQAEFMANVGTSACVGMIGSGAMAGAAYARNRLMM